MSICIHLYKHVRIHVHKYTFTVIFLSQFSHKKNCFIPLALARRARQNEQPHNNNKKKKELRFQFLTLQLPYFSPLYLLLLLLCTFLWQHMR